MIAEHFWDTTIQVDKEPRVRLFWLIAHAKSWLSVVTPEVTTSTLIEITKAARSGLRTELILGTEAAESADHDGELAAALSAGTRVLQVDDLGMQLALADNLALVRSGLLLEGAPEYGMTIKCESRVHAEMALVVARLRLLATPIKQTDRWSCKLIPGISVHGGHCISCGEDLANNPRMPFCQEHYEVWADGGCNWYREGVFCHRCGQGCAGIARARPLCNACEADLHVISEAAAAARVTS